MNAVAEPLAPASVMQTLRVINAEQRVQLGVAEARVADLAAKLHEQQRLTSALQARVDKLRQEVYRLKGCTF